MTGKEFAVDECTRSLMSGYNKGKISISEIKDLLQQAEQDEEFEVAIAIKIVLDKLC